jgi:hypothetical protein
MPMNDIVYDFGILFGQRNDAKACNLLGVLCALSGSSQGFRVL